MTAWEHFDRLLAERAEKRRGELGFGGNIMASALEDVRTAAKEAYAQSVKDRPANEPEGR